MMKESNTKFDRLAGADAISAKAVAIGSELDVIVSECVWDLGSDTGHEYAHRLELGTQTNKVLVYFSDLDLRVPGNESRKERVEDRLHRAISKLVLRTPAPTYTYR
jgi:hypothetical protein